MALAFVKEGVYWGIWLFCDKPLFITYQFCGFWNISIHLPCCFLICKGREINLSSCQNPLV